MSDLEYFRSNFLNDLAHFTKITGSHPKICILNELTHAEFEALCRNECTARVNPKDPMYGKKQYMGIDIFEGGPGRGMLFGK